MFSQSPEELRQNNLGLLEGKSLEEIMANCPPSSQFEDQSPKPSSPGYPLEVTVNEESPGPSGEGPGRRTDLRGLTSKEERVQR